MPKFYVVQLLPTDAPSRIKLGISSDVPSRVSNYRTLCPEARVVKTYPCANVQVERNAMIFVENAGFERIGPELFRCHVLSELLTALNLFFHSPLVQRSVPLRARNYGHITRKRQKDVSLSAKDEQSLIDYLYYTLAKMREERDRWKREASAALALNKTLQNGQEIKALRREREGLRKSLASYQANCTQLSEEKAQLKRLVHQHEVDDRRTLTEVAALKRRLAYMKGEKTF